MHYIDASRYTDIEIDEFDEHAINFVVIKKKHVIGGVRVIHTSPDNKSRLPMMGSQEPSEYLLPLRDVLARDIEQEEICEVSRLVLVHHLRTAHRVQRLFSVLYHYVRESGVDIVLCTASDATAPLYLRLGFQFWYRNGARVTDEKPSGQWFPMFLDLRSRQVSERLDERFAYEPFHQELRQPIIGPEGDQARN